MIGYGRQSIDESDIQAVVSVLRGDFLTCGPAIEAFEKEICRVSGASHAVAVSNGTSALRILYQAHGIGPGVRIGVPNITFMATASQAMILGADVVLLDVDPANGLLTPEILDACDHDLDWVVPVHVAGRMCDMSGLAEVAQRKGIRVLDDGAHAFGSTWADGGSCGDGTFSEGTTFSFHPVKNITAGEGGAIVTEDSKLAETLRSLRHHGVLRRQLKGALSAADAGAPWYHEFQHIAGNERLSDIHAALGQNQCLRIQSFKEARQKCHDFYRHRFAGFSGLEVPLALQDQSPFWHLCPLIVEWSMVNGSKQQLFDRAHAAGIGLQVHYIPLHCQPICKDLLKSGNMAGSLAWYANEVSLPCFPGLSEEQLNHVAQTIESALGIGLA